MCTFGGKRRWFHTWSKWSKPSVRATVRSKRYNTSSDVMIQERECTVCGEVEWNIVADLGSLTN